jgi:mannose-6-phosphate isomerase-like protein (cupin superfamily)
MRVIDLTAVPVGPTEFGRWAALNAALGVEAYGVNLIEAGPDEELELAHDEADTAQQELFVVIAGRARFTVGDETIDAGPGTAVAVGDPALTRGHKALEPGTRVLCIGARPSGQATQWGYWIGGSEP